MTDTVIAVQNELLELVITETPVTTLVTSLGQQGPQGIQGLPGAPGPAGLPGPSAAISTASDVDVSTLKSGSLLIYSQSTDKWTSTDTLVAQIVDSGQY